MCVIVASIDQRKNPITKTDIIEACDSNPHGWGFAARYADGRIKIAKGFSAKRAWDVVQEHKDAEDHVFHARIATSGEQDLANCHPFAAHSDNEERWLFHNGILSGIPMPNPKYCDTWHLAQTIRRYRTTPQLLEWAQKFAEDERSKFVMVTPYWVYILNEKAGVWRAGKWYSNYTAFPTARHTWNPVAYCMTCNRDTEEPLRFHADHTWRKLTKKERRQARRGTRYGNNYNTASGTTIITSTAPSKAALPASVSDVGSVGFTATTVGETDDGSADEHFREWLENRAQRSGVSVRDVDPDDDAVSIPVTVCG